MNFFYYYKFFNKLQKESVKNFDSDVMKSIFGNIDYKI